MSQIRDLWRREPARISALVASLIVAVLAAAGVAVPVDDVSDAVTLIAPILLAGELTRREVVPVGNLAADPALLPPDAVDEVG